MFEKYKKPFCYRCYPAPDWKSGLTVRSPLPRTEEAEIVCQSPLVDFILLAPISNPGRVNAMNDTSQTSFYRIKFSNTAAAPIPPPTHIVANPYRTPRRFISCSKVAVTLAPVQPNG